MVMQEDAELRGMELPFEKAARHLGLSEYEARVYVSLVVDGGSEARRLSMRCGVPRTKVYATLKKLMERGLVLEVPGEPRRFTPTSPVEAFELHLLRFKEKTSERIASLMESRKIVSLLQEAYEKKQSSVEPRKEEIWIVQGRSEVLRQMREMLSHAKKSVEVVTNEDEFIWFSKAFDKLLDKLAENGVNIKIGTPINSHNGSLARELNYIYNVKHVDVRLPMIYLCVDDQAFFLGKLNLDSVGSQSEENSGIFCDSSTLHDFISPLLPTLAG